MKCLSDVLTVTEPPQTPPDPLARLSQPRDGRPRLFWTTREESFRHNCPEKGEGGCRETQALQCRANCGRPQAGRDGATGGRSDPPPGDCRTDLLAVEAAGYRAAGNCP